MFQANDIIIYDGAVNGTSKYGQQFNGFDKESALRIKSFTNKSNALNKLDFERYLDMRNLECIFLKTNLSDKNEFVIPEELSKLNEIGFWVVDTLKLQKMSIVNYFSQTIRVVKAVAEWPEMSHFDVEKIIECFEGYKLQVELDVFKIKKNILDSIPLMKNSFWCPSMININNRLYNAERFEKIGKQCHLFLSDGITIVARKIIIELI